MGSDLPPLSELRRAQNRAPDQIPTVYNLTPDQSELSRAVDDEPSRRRAEPTASRATIVCLSTPPPPADPLRCLDEPNLAGRGWGVRPSPLLRRVPQEVGSPRTLPVRMTPLQLYPR